MARKPPRSAEDRLVRWSRSMTPGTLSGRIAAASPLAVDLSALAARLRTSPGAPNPVGDTGWQQDDFTAAVTGTPPPTAYSLTFLPVSQSERVYINGLRQRPAVDYTLSGQTLSMAAGLLVAGDNLCADYEYLASVPTAPTVGPLSVGDPTSFQILSDTATLGAAAPSLFPGDHYAAWVETGRQYNDVTAVVTAIPSGGIYIGCAIGHTNASDVWWIGAAIGTGFIGQTVHASGSGAGGPMVGTPSTPFTVRAAVSSSGVLSIWVNGSPAGTFDVAAVVPTAWTALQGSTKVGFLMDAPGQTLDSFQTTDGVWSSSFNLANQQGLANMDTGQAWSYNP